MSPILIAPDEAQAEKRIHNSEALVDEYDETMSHEGQEIVRGAALFYQAHIESETYWREIESEFERKKALWHKECKFLSDPVRRHDNRHYRAIVRMGDRVVPLLLEDMKSESTDWFSALHQITGDNPVPSDHQGDVLAMVSDWLAWGQEHQLI